MQIAGLPPGKSLVVAAFIGSDKENATQMWMQLGRALQAGVGDDGPSRSKALFGGSNEGIESLLDKFRPILLRQVSQGRIEKSAAFREPPHDSNGEIGYRFRVRNCECGCLHDGSSRNSFFLQAADNRLDLLLR